MGESLRATGTHFKSTSRCRCAPLGLLDSTERERLQWNTLHRDYMYGVSAVVPSECDQRGERGGPWNAMPVLLEPG